MLKNDATVKAMTVNLVSLKQINIACKINHMSADAPFPQQSLCSQRPSI